MLLCNFPLIVTDYKFAALKFYDFIAVQNRISSESSALKINPTELMETQTQMCLKISFSTLTLTVQRLPA